MSKDAQDYLNAAKRVEKRMLTGQFGSTGIDFSETPDLSPQNKLDATKTANTSENPMMKAVLNGFDTGNQGAAMVGLMTNGGNNASIIATNAQSTDNGMGGSAGKQDEEKKKREDFDRLLAQLAQRMAEIDRQMDGLRQKIAANENAISKLDIEKANILALDAKLEAHLSGKEKLKVSADGKMEDPQVEAALQAYEARTGRKVDRNHPDDAFKDMLVQDKKRLNEIEAERKKREGENNDYQQQLHDLGIQKTKISDASQELKGALESGDQKKISAAGEKAAEVSKIEVNLPSKEKNDFDDLNALNDLNGQDDSKIALNTSVASEIDQQTNDVRIKGNFNGQALPVEKAEIAAVLDKNLTAKPV
jgi:chromosome segregation ATPase